MQIKITTDRLPNKYPKGEIFEETSVLRTLVEQGEAVEYVEKEVKETVKETVKKTVKKTIKKIKK